MYEYLNSSLWTWWMICAVFVHQRAKRKHGSSPQMRIGFDEFHVHYFLRKIDMSFRWSFCCCFLFVTWYHHPGLLTHFSLLNQLSSGLEMIHSYQKGLHSFICRHVFCLKSLLQEFEDSVVVDLGNHVQEKASNKWKRREKRANIHTQILQIKIILQIHRWREGVYQNVTKDIYKVLIKLLHLCLA